MLPRLGPPHQPAALTGSLQQQSPPGSEQSRRGVVGKPATRCLLKSIHCRSSITTSHSLREHHLFYLNTQLSGNINKFDVVTADTNRELQPLEQDTGREGWVHRRALRRLKISV